MPVPKREVGLVIRFNYLRRRERDQGRDNARDPPGDQRRDASAIQTSPSAWQPLTLELRPLWPDQIDLRLRHGLSDRLIAEVIETVRASVSDWPRFAREAGVTRRSQKAVSLALEDVWRRF